MVDPKPNSLMDRVVANALRGPLPIIFFIGALLLGAIALEYTPREEEPQIVVPMVDVLVEVPGLSASQVERQVTIPLEKLLTQIPGVEHVYSTSQTSSAIVTLRFFVGEDREDSILNTYNKIHSNLDRIPPVVKNWLVKPIEVDDVPILLIALWSGAPDRYSDFELRRLAEEASIDLQSIPDTSEVWITGGRPRAIQLLLEPESMAARKTTTGDIVDALRVSNLLQSAGRVETNNQSHPLESGDFIADVASLSNFVVNVVDGVPVYLQDVARIKDAPREQEHYTWLDFALGHERYQSHSGSYPMVTISVAKQKGSNAVWVAQRVHEKIAQLQAELLPPEIHVEVIRDYGETADEKVNNLTTSLAFAVVTVVIFIGVFLGWRPAIVVGLAVPVCYGVTLALDMFFGYTINRVTLFALILSLGLLVDDPITGIDNIERFLRTTVGETNERIVAAMAEIRSALLMSTLTIILAFVPLAFITGMMGPYMAPMAFNVPVSVSVSTLVAFLLTPWLASRILKPGSNVTNEAIDDERPIYTRILSPLLSSRRTAKAMLWVVLILFLIAALLPVLRMVPLKLLPFDNKNEIQIIIDMPENSSLESTAATARQVSEAVKQIPEIRAIAAFVGVPSAMDFNGMVRHYYQRHAPYLADLRLTLVDKARREHQSHAVVLRLRELLKPLAQGQVRIKVVEVPPGPPVLSTLVTEIYGDTLTPYAQLRRAAQFVIDRLSREPHVVEIDSTVESEQMRWRFVVDKTKAALSGISTEDINATLITANQGYVASYLHLPREARPLPIEIRLPEAERGAYVDFKRLQVKGRPGIVKQQTAEGLDSAPQPLVSIGELGEFREIPADQAIYRKDLKPVVYVTAEVSGRTPAEVIADVSADMNSDVAEPQPTNWQSRDYLTAGGGDSWSFPDAIQVNWSGEGEWRITVRVFRDMGLAFAFALIAIFVVLRLQTASSTLAMIIMSSIPLTIIGIMPGFWLLNQFGESNIAGVPDPILFTATAMIGMIALAGIVVRNSLILVEFIGQARAAGLPLKAAVIQAGTVRMRPVLLTAGTTLLGNLVIVLDPVFSGLAWAIIFGILSSTLFTLIVVPVVYFLVFDNSAVGDQY